MRLPCLCAPLRRKIKEVSTDGAYDTKYCHEVLQRKGAKPLIPPRSNAALWEDGHPRNIAVEALHKSELAQWKIDEGYHQRSLSETSMGRYKDLIGSTLTLRDYNAQVGEALAGVKALNKLIDLGMAVRNQIG